MFGLLADNTEDIVVKADRHGFIDRASFGLELIGIRLDECLIAPQLADLADPAHAAAVRRFHNQVIEGTEPHGWLEFPAGRNVGGRRWFRLSLRPVPGRDGSTVGVVGIMRCIDERRALEDELFAAAMTDPLTGLANRGALVSMLQHLCIERERGSIALFSLDRLRRLNLLHGQAAGDEMLRAFADLMRTVLNRDHILGRMGGETFAVLMPRNAPDEAERIAADFVTIFTGLSCDDDAASGPVGVSGGIAPIGASVDATLLDADAALVRARARGGSRVERIARASDAPRGMAGLRSSG
ncbi:sensor domain-containing diguanylate cyclase [Leptolyngbya sp. 15MV]|nr:sensor domain-containing diguanylate cyclase [Leptolyngbya sp. 15MV]